MAVIHQGRAQREMDIIATFRPVNEKSSPQIVSSRWLCYPEISATAEQEQRQYFFSLVINVLSVRLKVNMNPDQFRLLSVCLCLSLSSGITIKSASHLLQGEPGGKMFCILSLMPQKLNALITSDLRWSALVTVPLHIFDLIHMHPMNARGHQEGGQMMLRLPYVFFFFLWAGYILARKRFKARCMFPRGPSIL